MSDKSNTLQAEIAKETEICKDPNVSKYHKSRLDKLKNEVKQLKEKEQPKKESKFKL